MNIGLKKKQQGAETLEFIVVFPLFMLLLMTVFDFSYTLYVWNALSEATRRGARMAIVCPSGNTAPAKNVAVFDTIDGKLGTSPVVKGLTPADITINYYNDAGVIEAVPMNIKFAEVSIKSINSNNKFQFLFPMLLGLSKLEINVPTFKTTLYTESLGAVPTYPGEAKILPKCDF
jgi:Flp pilus assembly protein TadG